jgi:hypothetical protein
MKKTFVSTISALLMLVLAVGSERVSASLCSELFQSNSNSFKRLVQHVSYSSGLLKALEIVGRSQTDALMNRVLSKPDFELESLKDFKALQIGYMELKRNRVHREFMARNLPFLFRQVSSKQDLSYLMETTANLLKARFDKGVQEREKSLRERLIAYYEQALGENKHVYAFDLREWTMDFMGFFKSDWPAELSPYSFVPPIKRMYIRSDGTIDPRIFNSDYFSVVAQIEVATKIISSLESLYPISSHHLTTSDVSGIVRSEHWPVTLFLEAKALSAGSSIKDVMEKIAGISLKPSLKRHMDPFVLRYFQEVTNEPMNMRYRFLSLKNLIRRQMKGIPDEFQLIKSFKESVREDGLTGWRKAFFDWENASPVLISNRVILDAIEKDFYLESWEAGRAMWTNSEIIRVWLEQVMDHGENRLSDEQIFNAYQRGQASREVNNDFGLLKELIFFTLSKVKTKQELERVLTQTQAVYSDVEFQKMKQIGESYLKAYQNFVEVPAALDVVGLKFFETEIPEGQMIQLDWKMPSRDVNQKNIQTTTLRARFQGIVETEQDAERIRWVVLETQVPAPKNKRVKSLKDLPYQRLVEDTFAHSLDRFESLTFAERERTVVISFAKLQNILALEDLSLDIWVQKRPDDNK